MGCNRRKVIVCRDTLSAGFRTNSVSFRLFLWRREEESPVLPKKKKLKIVIKLVQALAWLVFSIAVLVVSLRLFG